MQEEFEDTLEQKMEKRRCAICGSTDIRVNYTAWGAKYYFCFGCDRDVKEIRDRAGKVKFVRVDG